jgi:hypothetical protein
MPILNSKGEAFIECGGCGNLFDPSTEVKIYETHDCETYNVCSDECGCGDPGCDTIAK